MEEQRLALNDRYKEAGARKEYLQYKEERQKSRQAKAALEAMAQDRDELDSAYHEAGIVYRSVLLQLQRDLDNKIQSNSEEKDTLKAESDALDEKIYAINRSLGIVEERESGALAEKSEQERKIKPIADHFNSLGRMDILLDPNAFLNASHEEEEALLSKREEMEASLCQIRQDIEAVKDATARNNHELDKLKWQMEEPLKFFHQFEQTKQLLHKKAALYDCLDLIQWKSRISELLHSNQEGYFQARVEKGALARKLDILKVYGFYIPNEEVVALADKLKGKCAFTQTGIEWLNSRDTSERQQLLERAPLLPFSVLVDHDAFRRMKNGKLDFSGFLGDYPIPVIDFDFLRGQDSMEWEDILFPEANKNLILSDEACSAYMRELECSLEKLQESMTSLEESKKTFLEDLGELSAFEEQYSFERIAKQKELLNTLEGNKSDLERQRLSLADQMKNLLKSEQDLLAGIAQTIKQSESLLELRKQATELLHLNSELAKRNKLIEETRKGRAALKQEEAGLQQKKQSIKDRLSELESQTLSLSLEMKQCEEQLNRVTAFDIGDTVNIESVYRPLDLEAAKSKFDALDEKLKGRNQQEADLRNRIRSCEDMMKKCADNMEEHYSCTVDMMEKREADGEILTAPDTHYMKSLKKDMENLTAEIEKKQKLLADLQARVFKLEAVIESAKSQLEDEIQAATENFEYRYEIEKAIEDIKQILALYREEILNLEKQIKSLDDSIGQVRTESERYQEFIQRENISFYSDECANEVPEYTKFSSAYYKHSNRFKEWDQDWKRALKTIEGQTQNFYIKDPIMQLCSLDMPGSLESCSILMDQLKNSMDMIREKIDKTQEDIHVLESYQQEFVRRCIQRADHALDILKKLPALSRIDVGGSRVNMIKMDFADFDEREKEIRMENHIQSIIREISEENITDRTYIAERLSTRELLAQVTNMEKATVRLYKVESIREHSRYLKWEHAVGSEGQSNALYFIFAVCLISFIRMLMSVNVSVRTKKVIIADNPFGATSAIYLWEPMFNILKANEVQLIAPGHNIPRELTSKFEVNYLLNQDIMSDSRTRVVVKDVRTEEDLDQMNYNKLEQMSLI